MNNICPTNVKAILKPVQNFLLGKEWKRYSFVYEELMITFSYLNETRYDSWRNIVEKEENDDKDNVI